MAGVYGVAGSLILLAMVGVLVTHTQTAAIINSIASGFVNAVKASASFGKA